MTRDDARKLIGGYATGSLTESERRLLFEAALEDQDLFDELAREQELKELLDEPGARDRLIAAVDAARARSVAMKRPIWVWSAIAVAAVVFACDHLVVASPAESRPRSRASNTSRCASRAPAGRGSRQSRRRP